MIKYLGISDNLTVGEFIEMCKLNNISMDTQISPLGTGNRLYVFYDDETNNVIIDEENLSESEE